MVRVIVAGVAGKMGSRIAALTRDYPDLKLVGTFEKKGHSAIGKDAGEIVGIGRIDIPILDDLNKIIDAADVIISFTTPEASLEHLRIASDNKKAIVIGTTGFTKEEVQIIKDTSQIIPIVFAPNMSVGVNLLFKVLQDVAKVLGDDFDVEIIEAHHRLKKDAPSGTALKMAQIIAESLNRNLDEVAIFARKGIIGERTKKEIGIQTIRAGDIVGEHTVLFGGLGERIEITHRVSSRDTFARGALKAALWVSNKPAGLYDMTDVLGLR
ncbi:MAG: 4-hydroxy-tetrahydrodipicolinate reductase [Thermodesulfovibrionales bacterium]|nr:4-hydroxy-tetrahydrodipicolinate reductase [Thermodesulfovibrionales bacterium]